MFGKLSSLSRRVSAFSTPIPTRLPSWAGEGGRSKHHAAGENLDPLPILDNALAVRDTVARLIAEVYAGKIHPRIAAGLAPLMNLQLRAIETTNLERRVAELEKLLRRLKTNSIAMAAPPGRTMKSGF
jgi:hypothetical protein